ncbi:hypothetical protein SLA2020_219790 [Shorea laevis]
MARDVIVFHGEEGGFQLDSKGGGLFLICMIVASLSLISMVVFACGDSGHKPRRRGDGGGGCGGGGGGGGHGHGHGSGGHGHGHGHGGGGCGGGGGGGCGGGGGGGG